MAPKPSLKERVAKLQAAHGPAREVIGNDQGYNIWYHKTAGQRDNRGGPREKAATRVNIRSDSGKTQAGPTAYHCIHFAKGKCHKGPSCTFLHHAPTPEECGKCDVGHDIFGRERHGSHRDDRGGVGNMLSDSKTLYLGKLVSTPGHDLRAQVQAVFSEFGNIQQLKVYPDRGFAFVTYVHRGCSEFAYAAMMDQQVGAEGKTSSQALHVGR